MIKSLTKVKEKIVGQREKTEKQNNVVTDLMNYKWQSRDK